MNKRSKKVFFSYTFCLLTYCVSSTTSMLTHYWLQSLQPFWPVDVTSSRPLRCCITHDSLFQSKMADVPACTASPFLIFHQYLQMFHFIFCNNISRREQYSGKSFSLYCSCYWAQWQNYQPKAKRMQILPYLQRFRQAGRLYLHLWLMILFRALLLS